ncbi:MAG TPA: hypothetical protein VFB06_36305 [Streptosporangiaceae bacterium]|nr:hypothetical protein [Streptosporangiaceae bacterium]
MDGTVNLTVPDVGCAAVPVATAAGFCDDGTLVGPVVSGADEEELDPVAGAELPDVVADNEPVLLPESAALGVLDPPPQADSPAPPMATAMSTAGIRYFFISILR